MGLVLVSLSIGCKTVPQCFPEVESGDVLVVELQEQTEPSPGSGVGEWEPETCHEDWGVGPGTVLEVRVRGFGGEGACTSAWGDMEGLEGVALEPNRDIPVEGGLLVSGSYRLAREADECKGRLDVTIESDELPTGEWDGSGNPPGYAWFNFLPDSDNVSCPETCLVRFGAEARLD